LAQGVSQRRYDVIRRRPQVVTPSAHRPFGAGRRLVAREIGIAFRGKPDAIVIARRSDILRVRRADGNQQLRADRAACAVDAKARRKKLAIHAKIFFRGREDF
jgi:hypothetical protein